MTGLVHVEVDLRNEGENTYILTGSRKRLSWGRAKRQSICTAVLTEHLPPLCSQVSSIYTKGTF